jgi:CubicO group peptidase (beta-lactamase class C family)
MRSLFALLLFAAPLAAQPADPFAAVKPAMQAFVDKGELAGAVTVVGRREGPPSVTAVGYADLATKRPMAPDTLFRIASMTKPITALAVLMLQEDGKLNVEDRVEKYLPEFTGQMLVESKAGGKVVLVKPKRPITLRDLLTHTSGLPGGYPAGLGDVYGTRDRTLAETTLVIAQQPLDFQPGTKWSYCNAGIDTLGRVVEVVSGMPYEDFLKARLFLPLGMSDTTFAPTPEQLKRLAGLYGPDKAGKLVANTGKFLTASASAKHPIPAGGLCSTGPDLAKLYQCLLNGGELNGRRVIGTGTLALMTKTQTADIPTGFTNGMSYGFGFAVVKTPQGVTGMLKPGAFGHGGAFATQSWADPAQDLYVILLIQRTGVPNADASVYRETLQDVAVKAVTPAKP